MKLFIVSLPIGNLEDITFRAIQTLKEVDLILCEDTREFVKIANKYEIKTIYKSFHDFNEIDQTPNILKQLQNGKKIAIVSDRGTPTISDPGFFLIKEYTKFLNYNITGFIIPIPGVSAVTTAIAPCIFNSKFYFFGFAKKHDLIDLENISVPIVFFEAPHRINEFLDNCFEILGNRKVFIAKEMTKYYETFIYGNLGSLKIENPKGEFVVIIEGKEKSYKNNNFNQNLIQKITKENPNISKKDLSQILKYFYPLSKKEIYELIF